MQNGDFPSANVRIWKRRRHRYLGKTYWIVKDPVALNYFRFEEEEYAILQMLDGSVSLAEIKRRFEATFPPQKITLDELQQFLGQLHRSGLVISEAPGQAVQLQKRRKERIRRQLVATLGNILAIRFKGVDPERFLNWLYPKVRWLFSPWFLVGCVVLWIVALTPDSHGIRVYSLPACRDFINSSVRATGCGWQPRWLS